MPEAPAASLSVMVLDDHALFREGVARLLEAEAGFQVSQAGTIDEALALVARQPIDVVLLDLDLGARSGAEFIPLARAHGFRGKVIVVAAHVDRTEAGALIRDGVAGIATKHQSALKLADGIRDVMAGKVWLDQRLLRDTVAPTVAPAGEPRAFTGRERTVLSHVFEGLTNKEIADRVGVSESAIKATLQQLFAKTGVRTRSQLVRIVLERYRDDF